MDQPENLLFHVEFGVWQQLLRRKSYDFALGNKGTVIRVLDKVTFQPQENHSTQNAETPGSVGGEPDIVGGSDMTIR